MSKRRPLQSGKTTQANRHLMNTTGSAIAGVLDNFKAQLSQIEKEIKADLLGKKEFEDQLFRLRQRKEDAQTRLSTNEKWATQFDKEIGPFEAKYRTLTSDIKGLYNNAKEEHFKGLQLLIEQFSYHPPFKRHGDSFSAVPFLPK